MRLSIVVPTFNTRELTLACLAALERHPGKLAAADLEIVVVDDGSSDGTGPAVRDRHPAVCVVRRELPGGFGAAANAGLKAASGDLLWLLNSDTEVTAGSLDTLLQAFEDRPTLAIAGPRLIYPDGSSQWSAGPEPSPLWLFAQASALPASLKGLLGKLRGSGSGESQEVVWVTGAAMALRRGVWEELGPLDEGFRFYGQDLDFCLAARDCGHEVRLLERCRVIHHLGGTVRSAGTAHLRGHVPEQRSASTTHPTERLDLLWADLVRVVRRRRGEAAARRAVRALRAGGVLRLAGLRLLALFGGQRLRPGLQRCMEAVRHARDGLALPPGSV